ncbi:MAG: tetratricopeptide repeat protein [Acidobacteria bacterium]|nr:tetratricopeptide repeat protein [Acidobacteriota bacterium]
MCGASNSEEREHCRRCQSRLFVVSGVQSEEDVAFDRTFDEGFSFDEHLLERISVLEEVVKRGGETLRQLLVAVRKQERNILVNHTGLSALRELLEQRRVLARGEWNELWQARMDDQMLAMEKRERFLSRRDRIVALFGGPGREEFENRLQEAENALTSFDAQGARRAFEAAYRLDENNYELAYLLGESFFDEGDSENALAYFRRVLELKSDHYEGLVYGGALHYERSDLRRAEQLLRRAAGLHPDAFLPHFSLGSVYLGRGDLPRAVAHLERAVALDPVPQALFLLGSCLYEMGRLGEAIRRLQEALSADPALEEAHQLLGLAYLDRRWNRKALDALSQAQRLSPKQMRYRDLVLYLTGRSDDGSLKLEGETAELFARAGKYLERDDLKQALVTYRQALALAPEHPLLLMSYALVCLQLDRGREIEALSRKVLELEPDELLRATAYATLIEALRSQGKFLEGNRIGLRLLDEGKTNFTKTLACYEMAFNLAEMEEDLDQALEYARRALDLAPDELKQFPLAALGWVHYKRREYAQAVECLARSNELGPSPTTLTHLGMALLAAGEEEEARGAFGRARKLEPRVGALEEKMMECMKDSARLLEQVRRRQKR